MAEQLKDIAEKAVRKAASTRQKNKKTSRPRAINPSPRSSDLIETNSSSRQNDLITLLKTELRAPFLGLVEEYVRRCSPKNKNTESSMFIFRQKHRFLFALCFFCDASLWIIFIGIIVVIALRGLGIIDFSAVFPIGS